MIECQNDAANVLETHPLRGAGSAFWCSWLLPSPRHQSHLTGRCSNRNWLLLPSFLKLSRRAAKLDLTSWYCKSTGYTLRAVMQEKYLFQAVSRKEGFTQTLFVTTVLVLEPIFPLMYDSTACFLQFFIKDIWNHQQPLYFSLTGGHNHRCHGKHLFVVLISRDFSCGISHTPYYTTTTTTTTTVTFMATLFK